MTDAFYEPLGDGRFAATPHTRGPWDPAFQHAGPPSALLGRELERYELPANVLDRLAEIGVLEPTRTGYDADDLKIIEAIVRFRAGGYDEALGFTVYDTLRYRDALKPLIEEEVRVLLERLGGEDPEKVVDIIRAGREPLRELIGAMHSKLLLAELQRQRG